MLIDDHLALTEAGEGPWRVCDTRVPQTGAAHIVASIEAHDGDVEVLWIRGAIDAPATSTIFALPLSRSTKSSRREPKTLARGRVDSV